MVNFHKKLALLTMIFVMSVIVLGAFTRLVEAGLGCPDWPGCYGFLGIPMADDTIAKANIAYPEQPYELDKAWPEMVHRYLAGFLGLLVFSLFVVAVKRRAEADSAFKLSSVLLGLICFQAALGAWTVTEMLHPMIVMGHLLGGFTTFSLLSVLVIRLYQPNVAINQGHAKTMQRWTSIAIALLFAQIALGGWTSANYAALHCKDLPICFAGWADMADFKTGFKFWGLQADTFQYGVFSTEARVAIHATHRIGAIVVTLFTLGFAAKLWLQANGSVAIRRYAIAIVALLSLQVILGVSNVVYDLPLPVAVAHNGVAALLLVALVTLRTFFWLKNRAPKTAVAPTAAHSMA